MEYNEDEICKSCKVEHANKKTLLSSAVGCVYCLSACLLTFSLRVLCSFIVDTHSQLDCIKSIVLFCTFQRSVNRAAQKFV